MNPGLGSSSVNTERRSLGQRSTDKFSNCPINKRELKEGQKEERNRDSFNRSKAFSFPPVYSLPKVKYEDMFYS